MAEFDVEARLLADATGFLAGLQQSVKGLQDLQNKSKQASKKIETSLHEAGVHGGQLLKEALHSIAGPALAAFSIGGLIHLAKEMRDVAEESRSVEQRFKFLATGTLHSSNAAFLATQRLEEYAKKTSELTGIDKDAIMTSANKIMAFNSVAKSANQVGGTFDRVLQASLDLQGAGFGQAAGMARMLGRAMEDPTRAAGVLRRMNIILTDSEKEKIKTLVASGHADEARALILDKVEKKVHGAAATTATTTAKMKASWKNLQEDFGKIMLPSYDRFGKMVQTQLVPALEKLIQILPPIIDFFSQNAGVILVLTSAVVGAIGAYKAYQKVTEWVDTIKATWIALTEAQTVATEEATVAQEGLNTAMALNPYGIVLAGISALVVALGLVAVGATNAQNSMDNIKAPTQVYDAVTGKVLTQNQRVVASGSALRGFIRPRATATDKQTAYDNIQAAALSPAVQDKGAQYWVQKSLDYQMGVRKSMTKKVLATIAADPSLSFNDAFKKAWGRDAKGNELNQIKNTMSQTLTNILDSQKTISHQKLAELLQDPQFDTILENSTKAQRKKLITEAGLSGQAWAKAFIIGGQEYGSYTAGLQDSLNSNLASDAQTNADNQKKADAIKQAKTNLQGVLDGLKAVALATRTIGQNEQAVVDQLANIKASVKSLYDAGGITKAIYDQDLAFIAAQGKSLALIQQKRDEIQATIAQARDYIKSTSQSIMAEADVTKMGSTSADITANMQSMLARVFEFRSNLSKLKDMGLDTGVLQELLNAGSEAGGATAKTLVAGGQSFIDSLNGQFAGLKDLSNTTAEMMGQVMYGTGVDSTDGLIKGLRSKDAELFKQAQGLGKIIQDGVLNPTKQGGYKNSASQIMSGVSKVLATPTSGQSSYSDATNPYSVTNNFTVVGSQDPVTTSEILFQRFNAGFIGGTQ
jgi:hypothetical protein